MIWFLIAASAVIVVVITVVAVALSASSSTPTAAPQSDASGSQPQPGQLSGTRDDWIESVCVLGSFMDGQRSLPGSTGGGICKAKGDGYIGISEFDSDFKMRNGVAASETKYYVSGMYPDGTFIAFSEVGAYGSPSSDLKPLTQFGFTINTAPSR